MRGQAAHVALQMCLHLVFGLHHKAQADPVAQPPGQQAQAKSAGIPQGVEQRGPRAQLGQALAGPGQVVGFLQAGLLELRAQRLIAGHQRLRRVERLGAHLAHMVHPHQGPRLRLFRR